MTPTMFPTIIAALAALSGSTYAQRNKCPPLNRGTITINQPDLYPINGEWNDDACLVNLGAVWNATWVLYDPYEDSVVDIIEFPGIMNNTGVHIGTVAWDKYTGLTTVLVDSAPPWVTGGADVSGDNLLIRYDLETRQSLWTLNMTEVTQGAYGGFKHLEHDERGNIYAMSAYPGAIMRADKDGQAVVPWVPPVTTDTTVRGWQGAAVAGDFLLSQNGTGELFRFDTREEVGRPVRVPIIPEILYNDTDGILLPVKYDNKILLITSNSAGVQVLRSNNTSWEEAEYLGTVPNPLASGTEVFGGATVEMGTNALYIVNWYNDPREPGTISPERDSFVFPEITAEVDALVNGSY